MKKRYVEEQIVHALGRVEAGEVVTDVCRDTGVSEQTFYRWKKMYAGMGVEELRRLRQLEAENRRLKQLVADLSLDRMMLQEVIRKKIAKPIRKRPLVDYLRIGFGVSERRACRVIAVDRASYRYRRVGDSSVQAALRVRLRSLSATRTRYGYRRLHVLLRREGWKVNHKRVYRLYRQEGLSLRSRSRKKRVSTLRSTRVQAHAPNEHWSMDFVSDRLADGRRFRVLTVVDNVSRVSPALKADVSMGGHKVVEMLEEVAGKHNGLYPKVLFVDNGPEFTSKVLDEWAHRRGVRLSFSRPGTPTDNPYIESFNGRLREECLDQHWFESLEEAKQVLEKWRIEYNTERPHSSLANLTPAEHLEYLEGHRTCSEERLPSQEVVLWPSRKAGETPRLTL
jgi:putative transposase